LSSNAGTSCWASDQGEPSRICCGDSNAATATGVRQPFTWRPYWRCSCCGRTFWPLLWSRQRCAILRLVNCTLTQRTVKLLQRRCKRAERMSFLASAVPFWAFFPLPCVICLVIVSTSPSDADLDSDECCDLCCDGRPDMGAPLNCTHSTYVIRSLLAHSPFSGFVGNCLRSRCFEF
jgi:hypothetical protein